MWIERILNSDNLRLAWEEVAEKKGSPGIDQVSIRRWRRNWEERLVELSRSVRENTYKPRKSRVFSIPKPTGGHRKISILTVTDRVLQRAFLRVVDDVFDRSFLDCSFGYRPGRGVRTAVPVILGYRDTGFSWVLDADVDDCFGSLDHSLILDLFRKTIDDPIANRLLIQWLEASKRKEEINDRIKPHEEDFPEKAKGIPLGAVISPLLCNIYLHPLDAALIKSGFLPIRYADDFCVFCKSESEAFTAMDKASRILEELKLSLEPHKTNVTNFERGFDFLGVHFHRDSYSFNCQEKRIEVKGEFDPILFYDYVPDGYEG